MIEIYKDGYLKYRDELLAEIVKLENEETDLSIRYKELDVKQNVLATTKVWFQEEVSDEDIETFNYVYGDKIQKEMLEIIPALNEERELKEFKLKYNRKIIEQIDRVLEIIK